MSATVSSPYSLHHLRLNAQNGVILSLFCLFGACSNQDISDMRPVVSDSIMVQVLIDLHLATARAELFKEDQVEFRDSILAHYEISEAEYAANMAYYREHPEAYHKIYNLALDELSDERYLPFE